MKESRAHRQRWASILVIFGSLSVEDDGGMAGSGGVGCCGGGGEGLEGCVVWLTGVPGDSRTVLASASGLDTDACALEL